MTTTTDAAAVAGLGADERELLVTTLDRWTASGPGAAAARAALDGDPPPDPLPELAGLGLLAAHLPPALGGGGVVAASTVIERLAAGFTSGGYVANLLTTALLAEVGPGAPAGADLVRAQAELLDGASAIVAPPSEVEVTAVGDCWHLRGTVVAALGPASARWALVGGRSGADSPWFLLGPGELTATPIAPDAALDGARPLSALVVDAVVPDARRLCGLDDATVHAHLALAVAAEAVALTSWCRDVAGAHARERHQFGRPIGQFQGVKHHAADLVVAAARSEAHLADLEASWGGPERPRAAAAAATTAELAVEAAATCIQVLGGLGFTWEHDAHLVLRRALHNRQLLGSAARWRVRLADLALAAPVAPVAPVAAAASPELGIAAWVLPVIEAMGTEAQVARWGPPLRAGAERWCQLFSEPGAGSDLASLTTRAVPVDGGWRITGQKVWTSRAHEATWGLCLARTSEAPRSRGISCFVVGLGQPGVEVRPLRQLTGDARFNEVFLDDVLVPADALLGAPGQGWEAVQRCLAAERQAMSTMTFADGGFDRLLDAARRWVDPDDGLRARLGARVADERAVRVMAGPTARRAGPADPTVRKLVTMRHRQVSAELGLEALGPAGLAPGDDAAHWRHAYLDGRGLSIGGGTTEILKNVVAERLLGLPRDPRP